MEMDMPNYASDIATIIEKVYNNKIELPESQAFKLLADLRKEGCDIGVIVTAVFSVIKKWHEKTGCYDFQIDFQNIEKIHAERIKQKRIITGRMKPLLNMSSLSAPACSLQEAANLKVNNALYKMQDGIKEFMKQIDKYLDYSLAVHSDKNDFETFVEEIKKESAIRERPNLRKKYYDSVEKGKNYTIRLKQSMHVMWAEAIVGIVDELKRVGTSERQAFIRTGKILNFFYPKIYIEPNYERVGRRYKYYKKNHK